MTTEGALWHTHGQAFVISERNVFIDNRAMWFSPGDILNSEGRNSMRTPVLSYLSNLDGRILKHSPALTNGIVQPGKGVVTSIGRWEIPR